MHWAHTLSLEHWEHPGTVVQFMHIFPFMLTVNPFVHWAHTLLSEHSVQPVILHVTQALPWELTNSPPEHDPQKLLRMHELQFEIWQVRQMLLLRVYCSAQLVQVFWV